MIKQVKLILGTMTFGQQTLLDDADKMVDYCFNNNCAEFDTAYVYNDGKCEQLLGQILSKYDRKKYRIATKVNPRITGRLDGDAVNMQLMESLDRLSICRTDILYLHFPDANTPVESALKACAKLYEQGRFTELGLSNFPAWLVADVYHKCLKNGWMLPSVYEGVYSALSRRAEAELFDALDEYNIRFYAYNPLAGGMLTGKYNSFEGEPLKGRFTHRPNYQTRYWKQSYFQAVNVIRKSCNDYNISMADAALRWLEYHSMLDGARGDGIIIGASNEAQLDQNLSSINNGELPNAIVDAINESAEICKNDAFEYFRFYNKEG